MQLDNIDTVKSTLVRDGHPFMTGVFTPNHVQCNAGDLTVIGKVPETLSRVSLRNTQNPVHQPLGKYHAFDGDGMLQLMRFRDGRFGSESPMAPNRGATAEDDGYVVGFVTDMHSQASQCVVLDARDIAAGPVARTLLTHQISSGTHSCWSDASEIRSDWAGF